MGTPSSPLKPVYAHHRLLQELLKSGPGSEFTPTPSELDRVARGFQRCGGSGVELYKGSIDELKLLRELLKIAAKKGLLTKTSKWGA